MKLLIAGDFFVAEPEKFEIDDGLKELFARCDYRIVNYEGPVADSGYSELPKKSGPRLMQPATNVALLKELKVEALTLANNHIMDQGMQGLDKPLLHCRGISGCWEQETGMRLTDWQLSKRRGLK